MAGRDSILRAARLIEARHSASNSTEATEKVEMEDHDVDTYFGCLPQSEQPQIPYDPRSKVQRKNRQVALNKLIGQHLSIAVHAVPHEQKLQRLQADGAMRAAAARDAQAQEAGLYKRANGNAVYLNLIARTTAADFAPAQPGTPQRHVVRQQHDSAADASTAPARQQAQPAAAAPQSAPSTAAAAEATASAATGEASPTAAEDSASRQAPDASPAVSAAADLPTEAGGEATASMQPPPNEPIVKQPQPQGEHPQVSDAAPADPSNSPAATEGVNTASHLVQQSDARRDVDDNAAHHEQSSGGVKRKLDDVQELTGAGW